MEAHPDFGRCNGDIGGHVDEIAKDLAGLGVVVAAHAAGGQAVGAARNKLLETISTPKHPPENGFN